MHKAAVAQGEANKKKAKQEVAKLKCVLLWLGGFSSSDFGHNLTRSPFASFLALAGLQMNPCRTNCDSLADCVCVAGSQAPSEDADDTAAASRPIRAIQADAGRREPEAGRGPRLRRRLWGFLGCRGGGTALMLCIYMPAIDRSRTKGFAVGVVMAVCEVEDTITESRVRVLNSSQMDFCPEQVIRERVRFERKIALFVDTTAQIFTIPPRRRCR